MRLVLLCHPGFMPSRSMPRFAHMLKTCYEAQGHVVEVWSPQAKLFNCVPAGPLSKWAGYLDQYVLFPFSMRKHLRRAPKETLFVFCDQALGPWVPLVKDRHHVVHVHDLLALRSAMGDVPENPTSITGRIYQRYIRQGYRRARHFISVSKKTRDDLHRFGGVSASLSEVVYNGMNYPFAPLQRAESLQILRDANLPMPIPEAGLVLNVGGGQWYKNLPGVVAIYAQYAARVPEPLPLWCVSPEPNSAVRLALARVPTRGQVVFVDSLDGVALQAMYSLAHALLFPSLAEGFGWPLIEAQACACPVITTNEPPMNEVAGPAACYLPRLKSPADLEAWARQGARCLEQLLSESPQQQALRREAGLEWVKRFDAQKTIAEYLAIYQRILDAAAARSAVDLGHSQSMKV